MSLKNATDRPERSGSDSDSEPWAGPGRGVFWLAVAGAVVTFLLLSVGGVVTSRDAGMVYETWPLSNGSLNPEGWTKDPDQRAEHGHRLLGALAGLFTVALAIQLQRRDRRRWVKILGWFAVVAVIAQGILGGLRVLEWSTDYAMLHGCTGQLFLCVMVGLAYVTSRDALKPTERGRSTHGFAVVASAVWLTIFAQIILGARFRHTGWPLNSHMFGACVTAGTVFWLLGAALYGQPGRRALTRPAYLLAALVIVQTGLGLGAAQAVSTQEFFVKPTLAQVLLPSAHQAVGALLLATSFIVALRAWRRAVEADSVLGEVFA